MIIEQDFNKGKYTIRIGGIALTKEEKVVFNIYERLQSMVERCNKLADESFERLIKRIEKRVHRKLE